MVLPNAGLRGSHMRSIGQIALGALVAVCISGASIGMDDSLRNAHQWDLAARQLEQVEVKIDLFETKLVESLDQAIRSLLRIAE